MDWLEMADLPEVRPHLLAVLLGLPRLMMLLTVAPFLGGQLLSGQLKASVLFALYLVVHPLLWSQVPPEAGWSAAWFPVYLGLAAKEAVVGFMMAFAAGMVFWAVQSAGFLMDNQRGASMAAGPDPLSGEETSPLGSLLFQYLVVLFFISGAFGSFLALYYESYRFWPVFAWWPPMTAEVPLFFGGLVDWLMLVMLLLAGPVVVASLMTDVALGLINRFASQLNVYILAMPIKSGLTMFLVLIFLALFTRQAPSLFGDLGQAVLGLRTVWPGL